METQSDSGLGGPVVLSSIWGDKENKPRGWTDTEVGMAVMYVATRSVEK